MAKRSYFDWNATAPLRLIEEAREEVAALAAARPGDVFFTSSGTEANMLALTPAIVTADERRPREKLLISAIEHSSVRTGGRFPRADVVDVAVDADGRVDLAALADALAKTSRPLVSIMLANNETGVVQPIAQAAAIVHAAGGLLHVDAVQAAGRTAGDITALAAALVTLSTHKIGGPKGAGALIRAREDIHFPDPLIRGGGQERGLRAGTENVAGIAAFGAAGGGARRPGAAEADQMRTLRNKLETGLKAVTPAAVIFGAAAERLPNTTLFALQGMKAETAVISFDLEGIAVSSGAACSSGKVQPSHVLAAMGVSPALTRGAVRLSRGWTTTETDIERFLGAWRKLATALSKGHAGMAA